MQNSINSYRSKLEQYNNRELISKALQKGEISLGEYYIELRLYYESIDKLLEMEHSMNSAFNELLKFRKGHDERMINVACCLFRLSLLSLLSLLSWLGVVCVGIFASLGDGGTVIGRPHPKFFFGHDERMTMEFPCHLQKIEMWLKPEPGGNSEPSAKADGNRTPVYLRRREMV